MSTRANPTVIGGFVLGAAILAIAGLVVLGGTGLFHSKLKYVLFFDSTVIGLHKGAPVMLRGVRIGEVTDVQVRWGTRLIGVYITVEPDVLKGVPDRAVPEQIQVAVKDGLRAQLKTQSLLTGVLYVALNPAPGTPIVLHGLDKTTPELPTIPTNVDVWVAKIEKIVGVLDDLPLADIVTAVADTLNEARRLLKSPEIAQTLRGADALLADGRQLVKRLEALTTNVNAQVQPLSADARATMSGAQATLKNTQAALTATQTALADIPALVQDVRRLIGRVDTHADPLLASLEQTSETARTTLDQARMTLGGMNGVLDQDSPMGYELGATLRELRDTARAMRSLADYLERMPDGPVYGVRRPRQGDK